MKSSYKWETYLLDALAIISALLTLYYFFLRRYEFFRHLGGNLLACCRRRDGKKKRNGRAGVRSGRGKGNGSRNARSKSKGRRRGRKDNAESESDSYSDESEDDRGGRNVQVNLVMDPRYMQAVPTAGPLLPPPPALADGSLPFSRDKDGALSWKQPSGVASLPAAAHLLSPPSLGTPSSTDPTYGYPYPYPYPLPYPYPYPSSPSAPPKLSRKTRQKEKLVARTNKRTLTRLIVLDLFFALSWLALFFWLLFKSKGTKDGSAYCPPGGSRGWCNAYNTTRAAGFLLGLLSGVAFVLDWRDRGAMNVILEKRSMSESEGLEAV